MDEGEETGYTIHLNQSNNLSVLSAVLLCQGLPCLDSEVSQNKKTGFCLYTELYFMSTIILLLEA